MIPDYDKLADIFKNILDDAQSGLPLDALERRLGGIRSGLSGEDYNTYDREKIAGAYNSVRACLGVRKINDQRRLQFALEDISKVRNLRNFRSIDSAKLT